MCRKSVDVQKLVLIKHVFEGLSECGAVNDGHPFAGGSKIQFSPDVLAFLEAGSPTLTNQQNLI